jgi:hypothetical protein
MFVLRIKLLIQLELKLMVNLGRSKFYNAHSFLMWNLRKPKKLALQTDFVEKA